MGIKDVSHLCLSNIQMRWTLRQFSVKSPSNSHPISHLLHCMVDHRLKTGLSSLCALSVVTTNQIPRMRYTSQSGRLPGTTRCAQISNKSWTLYYNKTYRQSFHGYLNTIRETSYRRGISRSVWNIYWRYSCSVLKYWTHVDNKRINSVKY